FISALGPPPAGGGGGYAPPGLGGGGFGVLPRPPSWGAPGGPRLAADQASTALFCSCGPASARRAPASVSLYCLKLSINS
ncbi:hypothetical protein FAT92_24395, partial [Klebsiella pneumoniae]